MNTIRDIFDHQRFQSARSAVVQKLRPEESNIKAMELGYTQHWPLLSEDVDLIVLAFETEDELVRELYAGFLMKVEASTDVVGKFRIYADEFVRVGTHDRRISSDAQFYEKNGGGGGARELAYRTGLADVADDVADGDVPPGMDERRLRWVRRNHQHFRDPLWRYWEGRCAVHDHECGGMLVASHIYPWRFCDPTQKTDRHNGLLLSAPLDSLFDRGLISFNDQGNILLSKKLDVRTRQVFSVNAGLRLRADKITTKTRKYLAIHRQLFAGGLSLI